MIHDSRDACRITISMGSRNGVQDHVQLSLTSTQGFEIPHELGSVGSFGVQIGNQHLKAFGDVSGGAGWTVSK